MALIGLHPRSGRRPTLCRRLSGPVGARRNIALSPFSRPIFLTPAHPSSPGSITSSAVVRSTVLFLPTRAVTRSSSIHSLFTPLLEDYENCHTRQISSKSRKPQSKQTNHRTNLHHPSHNAVQQGPSHRLGCSRAVRPRRGGSHVHPDGADCQRALHHCHALHHCCLGPLLHADPDPDAVQLFAHPRPHQLGHSQRVLRRGSCGHPGVYRRCARAEDAGRRACWSPRCGWSVPALGAHPPG